MSWFSLLRPHQWVKNSFVFIGILFSHAFIDMLLLEKATLAFFAFCLVSSCVYIYNDIIDYPQDKLHPTKKNRPLALGKINPKVAMGMAILLFLLSLSVGLIASERVALFIILYFLLNMAYTHVLKKVVIIDVFCISAGFILRILAGTTGIGIMPSGWLLFCGLTLTLFLGFTKRRAETTLTENPILSRAVLKEYGRDFLDKMIVIMASCTILSYALYTMSPETIHYHQTQNLIYTVPFVVYGIFRYLYLLHRKRGGEDTAMDLMKDKSFMLAVLGWLLMVVYMIS
jgi:4-hydroxybenzoate polyprenyltransferase